MLFEGGSMKSKLLITAVAISSVAVLSVFQNCSPIKFGTESSNGSATSASTSEIVGSEQNGPTGNGGSNGSGGNGSQQTGTSEEDQRKVAALLIIL